MAVNTPGIVVGSMVGVNFNQTDITAQFALGTRVNTTAGGSAVYVQALSEISTYAAVSVYTDGTAQMLTTTTAATSRNIAFAQTSIASASYGWVQNGPGTLICNIAANCNQYNLLFTTATAGYLDDATVSNCIVMGVVMDSGATSISNATARTIALGGPGFIGFFSNPA